MSTVTALVPMRHHSVRVPGKNYRNFSGAPLYSWIIKTLKMCPNIARVAVDTDSPIIAEQVHEDFPDVLILKRPQHLAGDDVPMNDVLMNAVEQLGGDFFLQTHSTNPLVRMETVAEAVERFMSSYPMYDSLFSVTRLQARLWDSLARPINHNSAILLRTQDLPAVYMENSCLYLFHRETLLSRHNRIGERPIMFELDRDEAFDIDEEIDFTMAELMFKSRNQ